MNFGIPGYGLIPRQRRTMTFRPCSGLPRRGRILKTWVSLILNPDLLSWCRLYIYTGAPSLWDVVLIVNARVSFIFMKFFF